MLHAHGRHVRTGQVALVGEFDRAVGHVVADALDAARDWVCLALVVQLDEAVAQRLVAQEGAAGAHLAARAHGALHVELVARVADRLRGQVRRRRIELLALNNAEGPGADGHRQARGRRRHGKDPREPARCLGPRERHGHRRLGRAHVGRNGGVETSGVRELHSAVVSRPGARSRKAAFSSMGAVL